jgi:hypothetical protein
MIRWLGLWVLTVLTLPNALAGPKATHNVVPSDANSPSVGLHSAPNSGSDVRGKIVDATGLISRFSNGQWRFVEVLNGPSRGQSGWMHQQFIAPNEEYTGSMQTQSLATLIEALRTAHPNKVRVTVDQVAAAMCSNADPAPSVRLLVGVRDLAEVDRFYTDRARSLARVAEGENPATADQVKIAPELMPGETWLDGFFRVEDLEGLLALPAVFSVENATMSHH